MVFYCECAVNFCVDVGMDGEPYLGSLVRMFMQALKVISELPADDGEAPGESLRESLIDRLDEVRAISHRIGHGVGECMDTLLAEESSGEDEDEQPSAQ